MRRFYVVYSNDRIGETLFPQFSNLSAASMGRKFYLSWSHYLKLMRISNIDERLFYEIESVKNDWSLAELKRQYNSSLYERLRTAPCGTGALKQFHGHFLSSPILDPIFFHQRFRIVNAGIGQINGFATGGMASLTDVIFII